MFAPDVDFSNSDPTETYAKLWKQTEAEAWCQLQIQHANAPQVSEATSQSVSARAFGRGQTLDTVVKSGSPGVGLLKKGRSGDIAPMFHGQSVQHALWFRQLRSS